MKFKQSLSLALILTGFILVWNAYESPNFLFSSESSKSFSNNLSVGEDTQNGFVSLENYSHLFTAQVSNMRLNNILSSSLPKDSCVQAYFQSGSKYRVDPIVEINDEVAFIPASTNKYITAALVLSNFEDNDTLETRIIANEKKQNLDIAYLDTSGDPSFVSTKTLSPRRPSYLSPRSTRTFMEFAIDVSKSGVKSIDTLVIDTSWFDLPQVEAGWEDDKSQVGQISALNIDEGFEGDVLSDNPDLYAARVLSNALSQQGISVGEIVEGQIPDDGEKPDVVLGSSSSPTIKTLVSEMLKTSDNVYAEQLLAAAVKKQRGEVNIESRRDFVVEELKKLDINLDGFNFENGSGYSTETRLTCGQLNQVIQKMKSKSVDLPRLASEAGEDGTLETRFLDFPNKLFAKTGTLNNVTALSGKLEEKMIFSFITNSQFDQEQGFRYQESVVTTLNSYPFVKEPKL